MRLWSCTGYHKFTLKASQKGDAEEYDGLEEILTVSLVLLTKKTVYEVIGLIF